MLLIMTVEPGFGGQKFLDVTLPKIRRAASALEGSGIPVRLQVDGGITEETIVRAAEAGADCFRCRQLGVWGRRSADRDCCFAFSRGECTKDVEVTSSHRDKSL